MKEELKKLAENVAIVSARIVIYSLAVCIIVITLLYTAKCVGPKIIKDIFGNIQISTESPNSVPQGRTSPIGTISQDGSIQARAVPVIKTGKPTVVSVGGKILTLPEGIDETTIKYAFIVSNNALTLNNINYRTTMWLEK